MKIWSAWFVLACGVNSLIWGTGTAQHALSFSVPSVCAMNITNYTTFMYTIYPPLPGITTSVVQDGNSYYSFSNNRGPGKAILGRLSGQLPPGITITAKLKSPPGANSYQVWLSEEDQLLVSDMGNGSYPYHQIIYVVHADENAVQMQYDYDVSVIYTLLGGD